MTKMQQLKWIERQFNFGFSPVYLPLFIERLRSTAPRIEDLTKNITDKNASFMPSGKWSVKQHIGHLTDLESLHDGRLRDFIERKNPLRPADMENKKTGEAGHNNRSLMELISDFKTSRENFIEHVLTFSEDQLQIRSVHPRLNKEINVVDLLHFIAEHDLYHQTQISNILKHSTIF